MNLLGTRFIPYFLPRKICEGSIFSGLVFVFDKRWVEFEVTGYNLRVQHCSSDFLINMETRFWVYKEFPFFQNQDFSMSFQSLDLSTKTFLFTSKSNRHNNFSLLTSLREKSFFLELRKNVLVKSRLLRVVRGGFVALCFGRHCFVFKSSLFHKFRKLEIYEGWFTLNLKYYGLLYPVFLQSFNKRMYALLLKRRKRVLDFSKRIEFYYFSNSMTTQAITLSGLKIK